MFFGSFVCTALFIIALAFYIRVQPLKCWWYTWLSGHVCVSISINKVKYCTQDVTNGPVTLLLLWLLPVSTASPASSSVGGPSEGEVLPSVRALHWLSTWGNPPVVFSSSKRQAHCKITSETQYYFLPTTHLTSLNGGMIDGWEGADGWKQW